METSSSNPHSGSKANKSASTRFRREEPRRINGVRTLSRLVPEVSRPILSRKGLGAAALLENWQEIVGKEYAAFCAPSRLTPARSGGGSKGGVLHVRVAPHAALEIQHETPSIIERINRYLGHDSVTRLKLIQDTPQAAMPKRRPRARPLDAGETALLEQKTAEIEDPDLRAALGRLGAAMLSHGG